MIIPFGLTNAPIIFMDLMDKVFQDCQDKFIVVLINDILIYFKTREEYVRYMRFVLQRLREKQLYTKFSICKFLLDKVAFFGHMVSIDGISMDPSKVELYYSGKGFR